MSDAAYLTAMAIMDCTEMNEGSAWIIADYLPKEICEAKVVYTVDLRDCSPIPHPFGSVDEGDIFDMECGEFLVSDSDCPILSRHGICLDEVHGLCTLLRRQCSVS